MPGVIAQTSVPDGFPSQLYGPLIWNREDFTEDREQHVSWLKAGDIAQIEQAVVHFKSLGLDRGFLSPQTFPLSLELASRLRSLSEAVHLGRGFGALRGLRPEAYTDEDNVIIYAGIASHVADERSAEIVHIRDRTRGGSHKKDLPPSDLAVSMSFHTDVDAGDILSLYTQGVSAKGGSQFIVSFWKVYNVVAAEHPGVLNTLAEDWRWQLPNKRTGNLETDYRPIIGCVDDKVMINFAMTFLVGSALYPLPKDAPGLTAKQKQALKVLSRVCQEHCVKLEPIPGDILFVNNLRVLHAREAYQDQPELGHTRHLLSIMLRDKNMALKKPACFDGASDHIFGTPPEKQTLLTAEQWETLQATNRPGGNPSPRPPERPEPRPIGPRRHD